MNDPKEERPEGRSGRSEQAEPRPAAAGGGDASSEKKELTPEEQMALYEENLKETDWGHQPC